MTDISRVYIWKHSPKEYYYIKPKYVNMKTEIMSGVTYLYRQGACNQIIQ